MSNKGSHALRHMGLQIRKLSKLWLLLQLDDFSQNRSMFRAKWRTLPCPFSSAWEVGLLLIHDRVPGWGRLNSLSARIFFRLCKAELFG